MKKIICFGLFLTCFMFLNIKVNAFVLESGDYQIYSSLNYSSVIDVYNGVAKNSNNIQLYNSNNSIAQRFKISLYDDGYYKIASKINEKYVFDVYSGIFSNFSNVQLFSSNSTNAQKWNIVADDDGYFTIKSYNSKYCLESAGGSSNNGTNIRIYSCNGTKAQKWLINKLVEPSKTINNGVYNITSKLNNNKIFDLYSGYTYNKTNVQLFELNYTDAQKWYVEYLNNGYYKIYSYLDTTKSLEAAGADKRNGTNLQIYSYNGTKAQQWIIKEAGDGYYYIISGCNGMNVGLNESSAQNGSNLKLYLSSNLDSQKFKFQVAKEKGMKSVKDDYYFISNSVDTQKVVDLYSGYVSDGSNIRLFSQNSSIAQKWHVKYLNDGYYALLSNKDENYAVTKTSNGNIELSKYSDSNNQKWIIKNVADSYYIISYDGYYFDLVGGSLLDGTNIRAFSGNGTSAQKFKFHKTANESSSEVIKSGIYTIQSSLNSLKVLDLSGGSNFNGTNIRIYDSNGTNAQKWQITYNSNGYYTISSLVDLTKKMDVKNSGLNNGTNVQILDNNNLTSQQWIIKDAGDGYYYLVSNCNGLYLDLAGASILNGTNIQVYTGNESKAQKFKFRKIEQNTRVIDVSYYQGTIDWNKVSNTGIYGVILRIGSWNTEDSKFAEYINAVKNTGLPYGIYLFSYANTTNGANTEAEFTKRMISKYNLNPTLGIYYDLEDWYLAADNTSRTLTKTQYDDIARTYINSVSSYVGSKYKVKIYADLNHANNLFGNYSRSQVDWIAQYNSSCSYKGSYSLWQYTSGGTLDGINGYVDMNYLY